MRSSLLVRSCFALGFLVGQLMFADTIAVQYTLSDLGSGQWQYDYILQGSFSANWGVAIYFPGPDYSGPITDLGTGGVDWITFALQPDSSIPAPGEFDIVALADNPLLSSTFDVTFLWNKTGTPGSQMFDLYDFSNESAQLLGSGETTPALVAVPEPASGAFIVLATLLWAGGVRARYLLSCGKN
jgi:hypothetical protein